jgi:thioredoxin
MTYELLVQTGCPCSGGTSNPLLLLVLIAGTWLTIRLIQSAFKKGGANLMNKSKKIAIVTALITAVVVVIIAKQNTSDQEPASGPDTGPEQLAGLGRPTLIELGSDTCIPCKLMAPILDELKNEYAGSMDVRFLDVHKNLDLTAQYRINVIPTQIFYDASGQERFRHEGFFSKEDILAKWKDLGVDLSSAEPQVTAFKRLTPAKVDDRPKENVCYMCDGDINKKTLVTVRTDKGPVKLCAPHCYFIMHSCLTEDKTDFEKKVAFTDWTAGDPVPATESVCLVGQDETTGRPWIKAFADRDDAVKERGTSGGSLLALSALQQKEMSHRCGFCERSCYPQDAAEVLVSGGVHTWGCCSHCALGVAARTGKDIEIHEKDRLTGQPVVVKTFAGKLASLEPSTAVAWFGQRKKPDGTWGSAGCFHQGFFTSTDNLQVWVERNPYETGRQISIAQALANKMKLSPEQIQKACKIGECSPK